jgi:hypothetical protein
MQTADVLDVIGGLSAQLKGYAAKLPSIVHLKAVPTYKGLNESFVASLEAFEVGNLIGAVQPLLAVLDHVERMHRDKEIEVGRIDEKRLAEYRAALHKILPGNKPELDGAGRGM